MEDEGLVSYSPTKIRWVSVISSLAERATFVFYNRRYFDYAQHDNGAPLCPSDISPTGKKFLFPSLEGLGVGTNNQQAKTNNQKLFPFQYTIYNGGCIQLLFQNWNSIFARSNKKQELKYYAK